MGNQMAKLDIQVSKSSMKSEIFNIKDFGKDVLTYGFGQFILLICGFINFLIIPKLLTVEDYGYWQLFMLFGSYIGILHLGFIDGLLIRWAGKKLSVFKHEIASALKFLLIQQIMIIIPMIIISYFIDIYFQFIFLTILIYAFFANITAFFVFTSQAIKNFKILTAMEILRSIIFLILIVTVLMYLDLNNYFYLIIMQLFSFSIVLILFILYYRNHIFKSKSAGFRTLLGYGKKNISIGIFILFGNLSSVIFLTIDRLFVSTNFMINEFAIYAFAITSTGVIYTFVEAISRVFFPYLAGIHDESKIELHKYLNPVLILSWAAILSLYFPGKEFIRYYLPQYTLSLPIMQILLVAVGFGSLIRILQINYYKVYKKQTKYFLISLVMLIISILLNISAIIFFGTLLSIALATLLSFGFWYILNEAVLKTTIKQRWSEIIKSLTVICCIIVVFFCVPYFFQLFIYQTIVYVLFYIILAYISYRPLVKRVYYKIKHYL